MPHAPASAGVTSLAKELVPIDNLNGQTITKQSIEGLDLDGQGFGRFEHRGPVIAKRMTGEFTVETTEGAVTCADGWLAIDSRGYPYPIPAAEFELGYVNYGAGGDTVKDRLDDAIAQLLNLRAAVGDGPAGREFDHAIGALEEAKTRTFTGLAHSTGVFTEVDLQTDRGSDLWREFYERVMSGGGAGTASAMTPETASA